MASRQLSDLLPHVEAKALELIKQCRESGIDVLIYCTYRSCEEQDAEYAKGRTQSGKIVTNAKGGESWHNWRRAFDCVPMENGRAQWNNVEVYKKIGEIGKSLGFEWGGDWKMRDYPHFQCTDGKTIEQVKEYAKQ